MQIFFLILIILACVILGLIVLIQNPKGGGLAGNIGGFGNQFMGVKQTTDVLEKGTWIFAAVIGVLCLVSTFFMKTGSDDKLLKNVNPNAVQQPAAPANMPAANPAAAQPQPAQPNAKPDSAK
jgi:preprotein translocase subunit SecG